MSPTLLSCEWCVVFVALLELEERDRASGGERGEEEDSGSLVEQFGCLIGGRVRDLFLLLRGGGSGGAE